MCARTEGSPVLFHRSGRIGIALVGALLVFALGGAPAPTARAVTVADAEEAARVAAERHLEAISQLGTTTAAREALERSIADTEARLERLKTIAHGRAAEAYMRAGANLSVSLDVADAGELARGHALLERVTEDDRRTFDELSEVREELEAQHDELDERRAQEERELAELEATAAELNTELAATRAEAAARARAAARASQEAEVAAESAPEPSTTEAPSAPAPAPTTSPAPPPPPPDYTGTGGSHPQHNHPFLTCTRAHESGGNYSVVSANGQYYGAYQFLKSTWNAAAVSFGRSDLVGVAPNVASVYDQDDIAWRVYQSQGNAPWGGRC